jgi:hypothetical protein
MYRHFWRLGVLARGEQIFTPRCAKTLQAISKPVFSVILNEVNDLNLLKKRDSSLRSE